MQDSSFEQGTMQLIIDQVEELIVTIIEEIRERPGVAAAILAAVVGVIIGSLLASGVGRKRSAPEKVVHKARGVAEASDLAALAVKLVQNPIVRGFVAAAIQKQLKRRFSH
jgi:predicted short-subunit dehydrogenase-like oxidoreductase (DUF2520 family)